MLRFPVAAAAPLDDRGPSEPAGSDMRGFWGLNDAAENDDEEARAAGELVVRMLMPPAWTPPPASPAPFDEEAPAEWPLLLLDETAPLPTDTIVFSSHTITLRPVSGSSRHSPGGGEGVEGESTCDACIELMPTLPPLLGLEAG